MDEKLSRRDVLQNAATLSLLTVVGGCMRKVGAQGALLLRYDEPLERRCPGAHFARVRGPVDRAREDMPRVPAVLARAAQRMWFLQGHQGAHQPEGQLQVVPGQACLGSQGRVVSKLCLSG